MTLWLCLWFCLWLGLWLCLRLCRYVESLTWFQSTCLVALYHSTSQLPVSGTCFHWSWRCCWFRMMQTPMKSSYDSTEPTRYWRMKSWEKNMISSGRRDCQTILKIIIAMKAGNSINRTLVRQSTRILNQSRHDCVLLSFRNIWRWSGDYNSQSQWLRWVFITTHCPIH